VARQAKAAAARITDIELKRTGGQYSPPKGQRGQDIHVRDVEKAIRGMDLEYIQCRDFGHSWRPSSARWVNAENAYETTLRCARCGTVRTRWLSRTGQQLQSNYEYASGYTVKGLGRLSGSDRDIVRLASVLALVDNANLVNGEAK
jgi:hypothetical protein